MAASDRCTQRRRGPLFLRTAIPCTIAGVLSSSSPAGLGAPSSCVFNESLVIVGTVSAEEDLEIRGILRGTLSVPGHCVRIAAQAQVDADVLARDLTVHGRVHGKLTATEIIDIRETARVQGHLAAPRLVLAEDARVQARIETKRVDAAVRVAQYRRQR